VTVIVVVPAATPVAAPPVIVATDVLELAHVYESPVILLLFAS
jgi:hypothetical protein